jgi:acetyl-CoA acetyltransferase
MPDLVRTAASVSSATAYAQAGVGPKDIDVVQFYDAFTIMPIVFAEDTGFCAKGEGGAFLDGGRASPGGDFPMNTSGGGLSLGHPGMFGIYTAIESVVQLRGDAGARQVAGAELALAHAPGGYMSSQCTAIFGTAATL